MSNQMYLREQEQFHNARHEQRIKLAVPFSLRYQQSEPFYSEQVVSENISRNGLCINTNQRIPVQTRVYLEAYNRRFRALAVVVHSNNWQAGLQIIASKGEWLIN